MVNNKINSLNKTISRGVFFILEFFITKNKKKYLLSFSVPMILFLTYLIINQALYSFIDYSILGIFDFAEKIQNYHSIS